MSGYLERVAELILNKFNGYGTKIELVKHRYKKHKENKNSMLTGVLGCPQLLCFQRPFMRHALPIGVCEWFLRVHHRSEYLTGQEARSTT